MEIRLFGQVDIRVNGQPLPQFQRRRELWLLALLVLRQSRETLRPSLAAMLWPEAEEAQALFYLRKALTSVRKALGVEAGRLQSPTPRSIRLELAGVFVDVLAFDEAVATGSDLAGAVELYRGPLLADCPDEWADQERNAREQAYLNALETLAGQARAAGDTGAAIRWLRRLVAADPYRESAHRALLQSLVERGDRAAAAQTHRDFTRLLARELGLQPSAESQALYQSILDDPVGDPTLPPIPPPLPGPPHHLPAPLTEFVGRGKEIEETVGWLKRGRLVTLVGPAGVGKTRLAIEVGDRLRTEFPDGVWFVDLAPLSDPHLIPRFILRLLGVHEEAETSAEESLMGTLVGRNLLFVFDNCEHLVEAAASLAFRLLSTCQGLRILATSREALGVTGEQLYRVPSLSLPDADQATLEKSPAGLLDYEAIRLFADRARQSSSTFRLSSGNAPAVVQICRQLDGIPLAIEMAAARLNSLTAQQIADRLGDRFALLTSGSRGASPRQRTLLGAVQWSHDLLTEEERVVFRRLSTFSGGCTLDAAARVCSGSDIQPHRISGVMSSLVEKSLVGFEERGDAGTGPALGEPAWRGGESRLREPRYRLLETLRQYAAKHSVEHGEWDDCRDRHLDFYLSLATVAEPLLRGPDQLAWLWRLEDDYENLRLALEWCAEDPSRYDAGLNLAAALTEFWMGRGYYTEGREAISRLLQGSTSSRNRARALRGAAALAVKQGDGSAAVGYLEESLTITRRLGDNLETAASLRTLALATASVGDPAGSETIWQESLSLCRALSDAAGVADALNGLGCVSAVQGNIPVAIARFEEARGCFDELGDRRGAATAINNLAGMHHLAGDDSTARTLVGESLRVRLELGAPAGITACLVTLAGIIGGRRPDLNAPRLLGAAERLREQIRGFLPASERRQVSEVITDVRTALGDDRSFVAAWQEGRAQTLDQAVTLALETCVASSSLPST